MIGMIGILTKGPRSKVFGKHTLVKPALVKHALYRLAITTAHPPQLDIAPAAGPGCRVRPGGPGPAEVLRHGPARGWGRRPPGFHQAGLPSDS